MKKLSKKLQSSWSLKAPPFVKESDRRYARYVKQLETNGFCDAETWSLDSTICRFILPRLKRFKEINTGYPSDLEPEEWNLILDKIIFAFEFELLKYEWDQNKDDFADKYAKYKEGMKLFAERFEDLWW